MEFITAKDTLFLFLSTIYVCIYLSDKHNFMTMTAFFQGMFSARGNQLLFADADGATKFADLEKLETELEKINTQDVSTCTLDHSD